MTLSGAMSLNVERDVCLLLAASREGYSCSDSIDDE